MMSNNRGCCLNSFVKQCARSDVAMGKIFGERLLNGVPYALSIKRFDGVFAQG